VKADDSAQAQQPDQIVVEIRADGGRQPPTG
jgi:hypothetical protein